jgi:hypothetical protein
MRASQPGTRWGAVLVVVAAVGCGQGGSVGPTAPTGASGPVVAGWFRDVTDEAGVAVVYRNGEEANRYAILESLGGGVAVLDYDGDGRLDLFFPTGGRFEGADAKQLHGLPPKLYRNLGGWKFQDVTAAAGLDRLSDGQPWFYSHGASVADYDRDGRPDLLATDYGRLALFHNEPSEGGIHLSSLLPRLSANHISRVRFVARSAEGATESVTVEVRYHGQSARH